MFNLENSINKWLRTLQKHRAFDEGTIREMELHVRDTIDDLQAQGLSAKEAFEKAIQDFGDIPKMAQEEYWNHQRKPNLRTVINTAILRSFYFIAIRNLLKHRRYFAINILGLSIGMASFIFISLYVVNELSYDRFHANYENIYTISSPAIIRGEANHDARSSNPLANTLLEEYPEVEETNTPSESGIRPCRSVQQFDQ